MKTVFVKFISSESKIDDLLSLVESLIKYPKYKMRLVKSQKVYFNNEGKLNITSGRLMLGFLTNRIGLDPNARGVFRIYKGGLIETNGHVRIARGTKIYVAGELSIGNGTYINPNTMVFCRTKVSIGANCAISWNCQIMDDDFHSINGNINAKPIIIEDNVWIGSNVTILKGVKIGKGSVIASGTIVTKDVPSKCLLAGSPGRIMKNNIKWN